MPNMKKGMLGGKKVPKITYGLEMLKKDPAVRRQKKAALPLKKMRK